MADWLEQYEQFKQSAKDWKPTELNPQEEKQFRNWFYNTKLFNNLKPLIAEDFDLKPDEVTNDKIADLLIKEGDYDYRGAWKYGTEEVISPYDNMPHWNDRASSGQWLKSPNHPTVWKEFFMQQYDVDPDSVGLDSLEKAKEYKPAAAVATPFYQDPFGFTIQ